MHLAYFRRITLICVDCKHPWETTNPRAKRCPRCRKLPASRQSKPTPTLTPAPAA